MHSYGGRHGTIFNFNSDFSGDITISREGKEISIPANDILELVAYKYLTHKRIERIESMDYRELLE